MPAKSSKVDSIKKSAAAAQGARNLELRIEQLPVASLKGYSRNTRTHSDEQLMKLMASIREFGFVNPVLVDASGTLIAGHGRTEAARRLGMKTVPCIRIEHMTDAQRRAYIIADNKIASEAGWDTELLKLELGELAAEGFDTFATGFDMKGLDEALADIGKDQDGKPPPTAPVAVKQLADMADFPEVGAFDFPVLRPDMIFDVPDRLTTWNGPTTTKGPAPYFYNYGSDATHGLDFTKTLLGFYVDDYRFERFWESTAPSVQGVLDKGYMGAVAPNFSTYNNWSKAIRVYSMYRSRWVGRYMQEAGIRIVPDIQCDPRDIELVCDGLAGIKTIALQDHQRHTEDHKVKRGAIIDYVMEQLKPHTVLVYAPEGRPDLFPSLKKARVVRVEPRMTGKSRKAQTAVKEI